MQAIKEYIDGNTLRKIRNMYSTGKTFDAFEPIEYRDTRTPGLVLQAKSRGAIWNIKLSNLNAKLGDFDHFGAEHIDQMRLLIDIIKHELREDKPVDDIIKTFQRSRDVSKIDEILLIRNGKAITWEEGRDKYIAHAYTTLATATVDGYKSALGAGRDSVYKECFSIISGRPCNAITFNDLTRVIEAMINYGEERKKRGGSDGKTQVNLTIYALKSCFRYFATFPSIFDMKEQPAANLLKIRVRNPKVESDSGKKHRAMNSDEIRDFYYGLNYIDNFIAKSVLKLQLLTGQRRTDTCKAIDESFIDHPRYGLLWRLNDKTNSWRILPLSEEAAKTVREMREYKKTLGYQERDSRYLFPVNAQRAWAHGNFKDGHIHPRTVSQKMYDMRLRDGFLDYSEIKPSTHDLRKSFVSYMAPKMHNLKIGNRTLTENDIRFITHLDEGKTSTASVTYDKSEYLDVKAEILATWEAYIKICAGPKNHSVHTMAKGFAKTPAMMRTIDTLTEFAQSIELEEEYKMPETEIEEISSISKMLAKAMFGSKDNQISDDFNMSDFEDS